MGNWWNYNLLKLNIKVKKLVIYNNWNFRVKIQLGLDCIKNWQTSFCSVVVYNISTNS